MKCKLTNLNKGQNSGFRLHGNPFEGECEEFPVIGKSFEMWGSSLDESGGTRVVATTKIKHFTKIQDRIREFETISGSKYRFELIG